MNIDSYSGMLKLFAAELVVLVATVYLVYVLVMNGEISFTVDLVILAIGSLSHIVVDFYVLDV
jgi:hypothetical protein